MNQLTLKCPRCSEALHYNKVSKRFECGRCFASVDPLEGVFSRCEPVEQSFSVRAALLSAKLEKCRNR